MTLYINEHEKNTPIFPKEGKAMNELAKEARRKYYRKYYDEHPEAREKKECIPARVGKETRE